MTRRVTPAKAPKVRRHPWRRPVVLVVVAGAAIYGAVALPEAVEHDHPIRDTAGQVVGYHHGLSVAQLLCWIIAGVCLLLGWIAASSARRITKAKRAERARRAAWERDDMPYVIATSPDPFAAARRQAAVMGGGAFLGWAADATGARVWIGAPAEAAVCVLAPPRAGKTTGVVMPSVVSAPGPVVVTSIKRDVLDATAALRARVGRCWLFDPSGREVAPPGVEPLRWSPVASAGTWDDSRIVARSMVAAALSLTGPAGGGPGTGGEAHFTDKATDTLAPMLYAAHHAGVSMAEVADWLYRADPAPALDLLAAHHTGGGQGATGAGIAWGVLGSVEQLADRERSSVYSTAQRVVTAHQLEGVRALAGESNFDPAAFATSTDTVYVAAGIDVQTAAAPVVVALLTAITSAVYARQRAVSAGTARPGPPVQMILDEAANIAPIADLPQWLSTAGGNGLHLVVVFQDLSQVATRWGRHIASGLLTLCSTKLILGGIADPDTLAALSGFIGSYDRTMISHSTGYTSGNWMQPGQTTTSTTTSTQRQPILEPGQIAQIPPGQALLIDGTRYATIALGPWWDQHSPWRQVQAAVTVQPLPQGRPLLPS